MTHAVQKVYLPPTAAARQRKQLGGNFQSQRATSNEAAFFLEKTNVGATDGVQPEFMQNGCRAFEPSVDLSAHESGRITTDCSLEAHYWCVESCSSKVSVGLSMLGHI